MTLQIKTMERRFVFSGITLADPGPDFTPEEIRDTYAIAYPDIATAVIETVVEDDDSVTYKFVRSVGTKG